MTVASGEQELSTRTLGGLTRSSASAELHNFHSCDRMRLAVWSVA